MRWVLRGHRLDVMELLRFPAMKSLLSTDHSYDDQALRPSAVVLHLAKEHMIHAIERIDKHVEGFLHRHQGTWLTIRGCTRSALVLLGGKLMCQELDAETQNTVTPREEWHHSLMPPDWRVAVEQVLGMLRVWEHEGAGIEVLRLLVETLLENCH